MSLPKFPFVVLDVEATGLTPRVDRVMELAILRFEDGEKVAEYESLYRIDRDIPPVVQLITKIRPENLIGKSSLTEESDKIRKFTEGAVIVGHNILYDTGMLKGEGIDLTGCPWIDTAMLASLVFPEHKSWSLGYMSTVLQLPHEPKHRAMGDVYATAALFQRILERLEELPDKCLEDVVSFAERGPEGYATLFSSLRKSGKKEPEWLKGGKGKAEISGGTKKKIEKNPEDFSWLTRKEGEPTLTIASTPIDAHVLQNLLEYLPEGTGKTWVAVKNLDASLRSLPLDVLQGIAVVHSPQRLLDAESRERFFSQESFTADEFTLAVKLLLYTPQKLSDFPIHGEERDVWKGKLACTKNSPAFLRQLEGMGSTILLEHFQLLEFLRREENLSQHDHIIIDDASMLEDTATKTFRLSCSTDTLRAGAEGNETLMRFLDLYQIWVEKVRNFSELRYLVEADLRTKDTNGLQEQLSEILQLELLDQVRERLEDLQHMFHAENLEGRIVWIEQFRDGGQILQSVPMDVPNLLWEVLYDKYQTILLLPPGEKSFFVNIIPKQLDTEKCTMMHSSDDNSVPSIHYTDAELTLDRLLAHVDSKVVVLVSSKRTIEQLYVKHAEAMEKNGVTLIAQGMSGGLGRMQAEFQASTGAAVWLLTPWQYEGVELPPESVDHLWVHTLPFDHPSHAVLSLRAEKIRNGFEEYMLPRLLHRLFRLLRTYDQHRREDGDVLVLDQRIWTKGYGKSVKNYLDLITSVETPHVAS